MNKLILFLAGCLVCSTSFARTFPVEEQYTQCQKDSECVMFESSCCGGCMPSHAVNKEYQEQLNRQKQEVCQEYTEVCPSFECMPFHYQAYCTEEGHCAVQIDCVISCDLMKMSGLDEAFARKYSQCECDMEEKAPTSVGDNCQVSSDCGAMDCSHLDNPVKTGYAPDCVRGSCKCMCYGCM